MHIESGAEINQETLLYMYVCLYTVYICIYVLYLYACKLVRDTYTYTSMLLYVYVCMYDLWCVCMYDLWCVCMYVCRCDEVQLDAGGEPTLLRCSVLEDGDAVEEAKPKGIYCL